jgi:hypothetical protein
MRLWFPGGEVRACSLSPAPFFFLLYGCLIVPAAVLAVILACSWCEFSWPFGCPRILLVWCIGCWHTSAQVATAETATFFAAFDFRLWRGSIFAHRNFRLYEVAAP